MSLLLNEPFVPWGNALLATTILLTLVTRSVSSFLAAAIWIGVEIAVGVMVVIAADAVFDVFGVIAVTPTDPTDTFDFFLSDLPNLATLFFFFFRFK